MPNKFDYILFHMREVPEIVMLDPRTGDYPDGRSNRRKRREQQRKKSK